MTLSPVARRFIRGPLLAACILTAVFQTELYRYVPMLGLAISWLSAPAITVVLRVSDFAERLPKPLYGFYLSHHEAVKMLVYFGAVLAWFAFLSLPFWSGFRIGKLSRGATVFVILLIALLVNFGCFLLALASFPAQS